MNQLLSSLTEILSLRVQLRPLPASPVAVVLPPEDTNDPEGEALGYAEGQSFVIEYVGSSGERSTRPITVISLKQGAAGVPMLFAKCHLRKTTRTFRVDRIVSCIDFDGEVHEDIATFLFDNFGMAHHLASRTVSPEETDTWNRFRKAHRQHLILLAAISHADEHMTPPEIAVIADFCAKEADLMGIPTSEAFERSAVSYIKRLRPDTDHIAASLDALTSEPTDAVMRTLVAALSVVDADGVRHPEERALLNEVAMELIGTTIL